MTTKVAIELLCGVCSFLYMCKAVNLKSDKVDTLVYGAFALVYTMMLLIVAGVL